MIVLPPLPGEFSAATAFGFTPDGRHLAVGYQTFRRDVWSAAWWDVAAGTLVRERHAPGLTLGGCGRFVSDWGEGGRVRAFAWDADTPLAEVRADVGDRLTTHVVAPGGAELVVQHGDRLGVHALPDGAERTTRPAKGMSLFFAFSPSGRWLYAQSASRAVRFWDRANGYKLVRLKSDSHEAAAVSADDRFAAVSGPTATAVTVWELATRTEVQRIQLPRLPELAWLPDGRLLATVGWDGVATWDVAAGREVGRFAPPGGLVARLAVAPDGLTAAALMFDRAGTTAVVWDVAG